MGRLQANRGFFIAARLSTRSIMRPVHVACVLPQVLSRNSMAGDQRVTRLVAAQTVLRHGMQHFELNTL